MTDNPEVRGYEVTCDLVGSEDQHVFGMNTKAFAELTDTGSYGHGKAAAQNSANV